MSTPKLPDPAKLVVGFFMRDKTLLESAARELEDEFGPVDMVSPWLPFDYTSYYEREMDGPLFRRVLTFETLINQSDLPDIKNFTNSVEQKRAAGGRRVINIDPGYMLLSRFILATGKDFSHRVYVGKGIYADLTLLYKKGGFTTLPWTYPDYAEDSLKMFLEEVRRRYAMDLKAIK